MDLLAIKRSLMPMSGPQDMGGGGGGGTSTGTQTSISELPEWARGYAKNTLEKGAALSEKPYQAYDQNRIAGFSPLQQQSQEGAANMQTSGLTGLGGQVAGAAALGGLNQDYDGMMARSQNFGGRSAAQYMNPYVEQALAPQLREAQRASDIMGQQNAAKAVGQGAFGGSRSGLVEAERQRNLAMQQGDIRATGLNAAYNNAQQQFNADQARNLQAQQMNIGQQQFGANLGLQGLNTALQGAGQLGALGGQQFQQGMDINKLQNAYGGQQQALQQQGLSQAYQDFQNQQNYPYKQLGFMSDLIRGLPLGQVTSKSMYEPDPTAAQQIGALGAGAYGLSKFMADGGMAYADGGSVQGYAGDDGSLVGDVDSRDKLSEYAHRLKTDQDLQKALQAAQLRGDQDQFDAVKNEMAMRASLRNGLAGAVTPQMAEGFSGGGILAFANRGEVDSDAESTDRERYIESKGDPVVYGSFGKFGMDQLKRLNDLKAYESLTPEQRDALDKSNFDRFSKFGGADPYAPMADRIRGLTSDLEARGERGKGAVALSLIPKILRPGSQARAFGESAGTLGEGLSALDQSQAKDRLALANMDFNLSDAQRKERMAAGREAIGATKDIEANRLAAHAAERADIMAGITGAGKFAQAYRPIGGSGAGGAGKLPQVDRLAGQLATQIVDLKAKNPDDPQIKILQSKLDGLKDVIAATKTSEKGPEVLSLEAQKLAAMTDKDIDEQVRKNKFMNDDWQKAMGDAKAQAEVERKMRNEILTRRNQAKSTVNNNSGTVTPIKIPD